jgi:hypothetical protein
MHWELWETGGNNLVDEFDSEDEGLQAVRDMLAINKPDLVDKLVLAAMYDEGEPEERELPPALHGEALKARLAELAREDVVEAAHKVHEQIRTWLAEEGWQIDTVPVPPDCFNIVGTHKDGRAINILQPSVARDHVAISLKWSRDRVHQIIGPLTDDEAREVMWNIYRDALLMGVDIYDTDRPSEAMLLRTHLYFDGATKQMLMDKIQLVNRAYALAMRTSLRALEAPGRAEHHVFSPEDLHRVVHPLAQIDSPLALAS